MAASADGGKKTAWTEEEDEALRRGVREREHDGGARTWDAIARCVPGRDPKSCRLRWCQHLAPQLDAGRPFTPQEDAEIVRRQREFGNKWATIALHLSGRSDNAVKNRWNSTLRKQLLPPVGAMAGAADDGRQGYDHDDDAEEVDDDVPVCLELFPLTAGGLKEEAAAAGEGDVVTDLTLGLPGAEAEEAVVDLVLRL